MTLNTKLFLRLSYTLVALCSGGAIAAAPEITLTAESFIEHGARTTIKGCDLVANKCGTSSFVVIDQGAGESNDEKRTWRKMKLRGLEITAIFPASDPSHYYLEEVVVNTPEWPIPSGLIVGAPRKLVTDTLGSPSSLNEAGCSVYFSDAKQSDATFCFTGDRINKVTWGSFID